MFDISVVFFAAILAAIGFWYWRLPDESGSRRNSRLWAAIPAIAVLVIVVCLDVLGREDLARLRVPMLRWGWINVPMWGWRWIFDGTGALLLAGVIAGSVLVLSLKDTPGAPRPDGPKYFWRSLLESVTKRDNSSEGGSERKELVHRLVTTIGPVLLIAVLFLLAKPGLLQSFGLRQVEVGGVTLNFALAPDQPSTTQNQIFLPSASDAVGKAGIDWRSALADYVELTQPSVFDRDNKNFEAVALHDPSGKIIPRDSDLSEAINQQRSLLRSIGPVVRCVQTYTKLFPFEPSKDINLDAVLKPGVDRLAALERALRVDYTGANGFDAAESLSQLVLALQQALERIDQQLALRVPDNDKIDCPAWVPLPPLVVPKRNAPYLAIFLAYAYAGLGGTDTGLQTLTDWMSSDAPAKTEPGTRVLYSRVATEFGAIQVTPANFPYSYTYRVTLDWERNTIQHTMPTDPDAWMEKVKHHPCRPQDGYTAEQGMLAAYLNAAALDLQAVVDSSAPGQRIGPGPGDAALAEQLLRFDPRTMCSWSPELQDQERAVLRLEAGRTLARWALEGRHDGTLGDAEANRLLETARRALGRAADLFGRIEAKDVGDGKMTQSGPMVLVSGWEPYRVEAAQELFALPPPRD